MKARLRSFELLCVLLCALTVRSAPTVVTVDTSSVVSSNFLGFGVQWSPYPWFDLTDTEWQRVFDRLDYMRVPLVRVMDRAYHYCDGYDAQGKPIYAWENRHMKKLYRLLDYCESRQVQVVIGEWDDPASPEDRADKADDELQQYHIDCTDPRWTRLIGDFLDQLIDKKHYTCLKYYNLINEPNGDWSHCADFGKWKTAITNLHTELQERGLDKKIQITGPDVTRIKDFYWIDRALQECAGNLDAYDVHGYVDYEDLESDYLERVLSGKREYINRYDPHGRAKPFFMGEVGMSRRGRVEPQGGEDSHPIVYEPIYGIWMTDYCIQAARAGLAGAIAWDLDDAMHIDTDKGNGWPDVRQTLFKKWGFFNSLAEEIGHPEDAKLRPWFYTWSLMSRYFPTGCQIVNSRETGLPGVRTLAATIGPHEITVALVNDSDKPQKLRVTVPGWKSGSPLRRYNYSSADRLVNKDGFPLSRQAISPKKLGAGVTIDLTARSFVLLTTLRD